MMVRLAVGFASAFGLLACGAPPRPVATPSNEAPDAVARSRHEAEVDQFCNLPENLLHETAECGGIGPLHIPVPPSLVAPHRPGTPTHEQWEASLTPAQHAFYVKHCKQGSEDEGYSQLCGGTPLVIDLADAPVEFVAQAGFATDWPTAATPWLAMDRDGDGAITSSAELFGPDAVAGAANGFEALAVLDANGDGVIDAKDPAYGKLLVWADRDGNRVSSPEELSPLSAVVDAIPLASSRVPRCDARRNCEGERAALSPRGAVIDVYLHYQ